MGKWSTTSTKSKISNSEISFSLVFLSWRFVEVVQSQTTVLSLLESNFLKSYNSHGFPACCKRIRSVFTTLKIRLKKTKKLNWFCWAGLRAYCVSIGKRCKAANSPHKLRMIVNTCGIVSDALITLKHNANSRSRSHTNHQNHDLERFWR